VNKKNIDPATFHVCPVKKGGGDAVSVIDKECFGAPGPEYYGSELGSATKGAGINTNLAAEQGASLMQAECKR
jgi:hypothetical protein